MKNYWKRFVAWVTGLKDDPLLWARVKITALYALSIIVAFLITNITLFRLWLSTVDSIIPGAVDPQVHAELITRLNNELGQQNLVVYIFLLAIVLAVSFLISGNSLSPI